MEEEVEEEVEAKQSGSKEPRRQKKKSKQAAPRCEDGAASVRSFREETHKTQ